MQFRSKIYLVLRAYRIGQRNPSRKGSSHLRDTTTEAVERAALFHGGCVLVPEVRSEFRGSGRATHQINKKGSTMAMGPRPTSSIHPDQTSIDHVTRAHVPQISKNLFFCKRTLQITAWKLLSLREQEIRTTWLRTSVDPCLE